ncbi:hypothetical protein ACFL02_00770 [Planctomycetota bacterium]
MLIEMGFSFGELYKYGSKKIPLLNLPIDLSILLILLLGQQLVWLVRLGSEK